MCSSNHFTLALIVVACIMQYLHAKTHNIKLHCQHQLIKHNLHSLLIEIARLLTLFLFAAQFWTIILMTERNYVLPLCATKLFPLSLPDKLSALFVPIKATLINLKKKKTVRIIYCTRRSLPHYLRSFMQNTSEIQLFRDGLQFVIIFLSVRQQLCTYYKM